MHNKTESTMYIQKFYIKNFSKQLNFFTCIIPDNVFHESPKEFWKNNHFENMRAGGVKSHFGKLAMK